MNWLTLANDRPSSLAAEAAPSQLSATELAEVVAEVRCDNFYQRYLLQIASGDFNVVALGAEITRLLASRYPA